MTRTYVALYLLTFWDNVTVSSLAGVVTWGLERSGKERSDLSDTSS